MRGCDVCHNHMCKLRSCRVESHSWRPSQPNLAQPSRSSTLQLHPPEQQGRDVHHSPQLQQQVLRAGVGSQVGHGQQRGLSSAVRLLHAKGMEGRSVSSAWAWPSRLQVGHGQQRAARQGPAAALQVCALPPLGTSPLQLPAYLASYDHALCKNPT